MRAEWLPRSALLALLLAWPSVADEPAPDTAFLEYLGWLVEYGEELLDPLDFAGGEADTVVPPALPAGEENDDATDE